MDPTAHVEAMEQSTGSHELPSRHEEHQYLDLINTILTQGEFRPDR